MIVLFGKQKGGSGASTLACNAAAWLACQGKNVLLLDTDVQATSKKWVERRNEHQDHLPVVHAAQATGDAFRPAKEFQNHYDYVLIDAGGRDSREFRSAMGAADVLIVPTKASWCDLETMQHVNTVIYEMRGANPDLDARAVVNMAATNPQITETADAKAFLANVPELTLSPVILRERKIFRDAMFEGKGVVECANPQAKAEIQLLCQSVFGIFN